MRGLVSVLELEAALEAELLLEVLFARELPQLDLPVLALARVFRGEGGGEGGEARRLRGCFLVGIDVFGAVPEPRVLAVALVDDFAGRERPLPEPPGEHAVEQSALDVGALDRDRLVVRLVVQSPGGVVVAGAVAGGDVVGDVQAAGDLVQDLALEVAVARRRLLGIELRHLPPARHREEHVPFELDRVHRVDVGHN